MTSNPQIHDTVRKKPSKGQGWNILVNTFSSYARDIVDILTFLILTPFLIDVLGKDQFGLWSLIWSIVSLFALADMGFGTSIVKYVADARGSGNIDRLRGVVCTTFWIYTGIGTILMLVVGTCLLFFNQLFDIPPEHQEAARSVMLILSLRVALCLPLENFRGVLNGNQKIKIANAYKILASISYFLAVLAVLRWVRDIRVLALLNLFAGLLPMLSMAIHAWLTLPGVSIHPKFFQPRLIKELSSFSVYFLLIQISALIYSRVDSVIIKGFLSLEMVAFYTIAIRLADKSNQFCNQLTRVLTPLMAEYNGAGKQEKVVAIWQQGTKAVVAFAIPLLVGLILLAEPLILAWAGEDFGAAVVPCQILVSACLITVIHSNTAGLLSMVGHHRFLAWTTLFSQLFNLGLSLVLIQYFGIVGVAVATLVAQVPQTIGMHLGRACREYGMTRRQFYQSTVAPALIPALSLVTTLTLLQTHFAIDTLPEVALAEFLGILSFGTTYWFFGLNAKERSGLQRKYVNRWMSKKGKSNPSHGPA